MNSTQSDEKKNKPSSKIADLLPTKSFMWFEDILSVVMMAILACLTFANVIVRYLSDRSFAFTEEFSVILIIIVTMIGSTPAFMRYQHIRIEYFVDRKQPIAQWRLHVLSNFIVLLFFAIFAVLSTKMTIDEYTFGDVSPSIGIPTWLYSIWIPLFSVLICFRVINVIKQFYEVKPQ